MLCDNQARSTELYFVINTECDVMHEGGGSDALCEKEWGGSKKAKICVT